MKENNRKSNWIDFGLFMFMFVCTLVTSAFVYPRVDEHIFTDSTLLEIKSIISYSMSYGNGRLLGNIICIFFSHLYQLKFLFISIVTVLIIFLLYKLFFNQNHSSILLIGILILFLPSEMFYAVLLDFPSFTNYCVPLMFFLCVVAILNENLKIESSIFKTILVFVFGVTMCLFSENTTGIIFLAALFFIIEKIINKNKVELQYIVFLLSVVVGSMIMWLIPRITGVEEKLKSYREVTFSITDIFGNLMLAADIVNDFVLLFIILTSSLCYITVKTRKSNFIDSICMSIMALYTLFSLMVLNCEDNTFFRMINVMSILIYCIATLILIVRITRKEAKYRILCWFSLAFISVGPMVFVNILSYRTFYVTYIMLLLSAFSSVRFCLETGNFDNTTIRRFYKPFVAVLALY